jgi:hypothetical protein
LLSKPPGEKKKEEGKKTRTKKIPTGKKKGCRFFGSTKSSD